MNAIVEERKYKVPEAAPRIGVADKTLWNWIAERRVSVYRTGRSVRIGESEFKRILEEGFCPAAR